MFCTKCGNAMDDGTKFCPKCGAKMEGDNGVPVASENATILHQLDKRLLKKGAIGAVIAILIIVVIIVSIKFIRKKVNTINLNDYVKVSYDGYNGYGSADASIDWDGILDDYGDKLDFNENIVKSSSLDYIFDYEPEDILIDTVSYKLNKCDGLSNGDKIKYKWKVDDRAINRYINLDVKYSDLEYTVSDLEEVESYDVFANLKVSFVGASPNASVVLKYTGDYLENGDFSCDYYDALKNGDKITVSLNTDAETMANEYGVVPEKTSKSYKVKCTSKYIEKVSEIDEASKDELKSQSDDVVATYIAGYTTKQYKQHTLISSEYLGDYCLSSKGAETEVFNVYGMVYKITMQVKTSDGLKNVVMYYDVVYGDLSVNKDGKAETSVLNYGTPEDMGAWFTVDLTRYYGFESLTLLKENRVDSTLAVCNYDWNVTDK